MGKHHALMGTVDRRGYGGQQTGTICDARGSYPSIWRTLKPFFAGFVVLTSRLDAYISRYGDFCANNNDNDDDTTDYFTPCAWARGNNKLAYRIATLIRDRSVNVHVLSKRWIIDNYMRLHRCSHEQAFSPAVIRFFWTVLYCSCMVNSDRLTSLVRSCWLSHEGSPLSSVAFWINNIKF